MAPSGSKKRKIDEVDASPFTPASGSQPKSKAPPKGAPPPKTKAAAGRSSSAPKSTKASASKSNNSKPPSSKPTSTQKDVQDAPVNIPNRSAQSGSKRRRVLERSQTPTVLPDQTAQRQTGSRATRATQNNVVTIPGQKTESASNRRQVSSGSQKGQAAPKASASANVPDQSTHSEPHQRSGSLQIGRETLTTPTRAPTIVPSQSAQSSAHKRKLSADFQNRPETSTPLAAAIIPDQSVPSSRHTRQLSAGLHNGKAYSNAPTTAILPNQLAQPLTHKHQASASSQSREAKPKGFDTAAIISDQLAHSSLHKDEASVGSTPPRVQNSFTAEQGGESALSFSNTPPIQHSVSQPQKEHSLMHGNFDLRISRPEQHHSNGSGPRVPSSEDRAVTDTGVRVHQNSLNRNPQAMNVPNQVANSPRSFSILVQQSDPRNNSAAASTMPKIPPPGTPVASVSSQQEIHPHPMTPQYFPPMTQKLSSVTRIGNAAQGNAISGMLPSNIPLTVGNNPPANPAQLASNTIHQTASPLRDSVLKGIRQGAERLGMNFPDQLGIYPQSSLHNGQKISLNIRHQAEGVSKGSMNVPSQLLSASQPSSYAGQQPSFNIRHEAPNFIMQGSVNVPNQLGVSPHSQNWDQTLNGNDQSGQFVEVYRDPVAFRGLLQRLKAKGHGRARASDGTNRLATISLDEINYFVHEYSRYLRSKLKDGLSDVNDLAESRNNVLSMLKQWHGVETIKYNEYDLEAFAARGLDIGFAIAITACNNGFAGILNHVSSMFQSLANTACQQLAVMERDPIQTQDETRKWHKTSWYYIEKVEFHFCRMAKERISEVIQEYSTRRQRRELQALQVHQPVQKKLEALVTQPGPNSQPEKDGSLGGEKNVQDRMEQSGNNDIMDVDVEEEVAAADREATAVDKETMDVVKEFVNNVPGVMQFGDRSLALSNSATT